VHCRRRFSPGAGGQLLRRRHQVPDTPCVSHLAEQGAGHDQPGDGRGYPGLAGGRPAGKGLAAGAVLCQAKAGSHQPQGRGHGAGGGFVGKEPDAVRALPVKLARKNTGTQLRFFQIDIVKREQHDTAIQAGKLNAYRQARASVVIREWKTSCCEARTGKGFSWAYRGRCSMFSAQLPEKAFPCANSPG
jgi:hypothetical protein